jgi:prepilin-type N-terminal cleavage/methylation domain-containing protein
MKRVDVKRAGRTGFTLVEILVVIAIIAILVGLLTAAVAKSRGKISEVRNRNDIGQLAIALEAFHTKYKAYPPSRIKLAERFNDNTYPPLLRNQPGTLDYDSVQFIAKMFPQILSPLPDGSPPPWANPSATGGIDWNGDGVASQGAVLLEGDQCLVFFLGGIPQAVNGTFSCTGFSTNPRDPSAHVKPGGPSDVVGPFYEFQTSRLVRLPLASRVPVLPTLGTPSSLHFSYLDAYGKVPFAYFSSYKTRNGYNRYALTTGSSDCATLQNVWPLAESWLPSPHYLKPETFQIVSAGADGKFGSGTVYALGKPVWTPNTASTVYPDGTAGNDDQSNYYDKLLGVEN